MATGKLSRMEKLFTVPASKLSDADLTARVFHRKVGFPRWVLLAGGCVWVLAALGGNVLWLLVLAIGFFAAAVAVHRSGKRDIAKMDRTEMLEYLQHNAQVANEDIP